MKKIIFLLAIGIGIFSCSSSVIPDKYVTAQKFIKYAKNDDIKGASNLLMDGAQKDDTFALNYYIHTMHDFFNRYGVQPQSNWTVVYDTSSSSSIVKLESIIIPIYKGFDSSNKLEEAYLQLDFDQTQKQVSHDYIVHYLLRAKGR
jgi:hypothetical protein